ncbi:MAG: dTDP-4-dehydrorhamnose reductase [Acidobacteriota bacterium]|nr:dTDP-4-dehydrorhamnose reductase [Acidobacteriota bacterium]
MKILITGAAGLVGMAAARYCVSIGDEVIAAPREDLDIASRESVFAFLQREKPDSVINCAAMTNVDGCETDDETNWGSNAYGVENLALGCRKIGANLVTISTDYVFDGAHSGFYTQRDDPNPLSRYGKAKLAGERLAQAALARTIIVRSGWIFGVGGRNFLSQGVELLLAGKSLTAISDAHGTPTYAPDLARRLRELSESDLPGIYHVVNSGEGATYAGFLRAVPDVDAEKVADISSASLKRPAARPANSKLRCLISGKLGFEPLPDWKTALSDYAENKKRGF